MFTWIIILTFKSTKICTGKVKQNETREEPAQIQSATYITMNQFVFSTKKFYSNTILIDNWENEIPTEKKKKKKHAKVKENDRSIVL